MPAHSALPLYLQISEMLIRDIAAGRLMEGERLQPERAMAAELGISVGTLRRALDNLTENGLLDRIQGSGNYVRHAPGAKGVYAFFRLERIEGGGLPTAELISADRMDKPAGLPEFGSGPQAYRIRRLRKLGETPAALEEIWLDAELAPRLKPGDLSDSLYYFYRNRLGLNIQRVEDRIGVGTLPDWHGGRLALRPGAPCGQVDRVGWAGDGQRAEISRSWFDPAVAAYVSRLR